MPQDKSGRLRSLTVLIMAIAILIPSMLGFGMKFFEFVQTFRSDPAGIFAITPISNYLLASLGFFCLLIWATMNGMFHDIERPKHRMLEIDQQLDRQSAK